MHCTSEQNNSGGGYSRVSMYNHYLYVDTSSNGYNYYYIPHLLVVYYHIVDFAYGHAE